MTKTKTPFFSLGAKGTVADTLTVQRRQDYHFARRKPTPTNPRSLPQMYQRWLYEDYAHLWTLQSEATRREYAGAGVRFHLTGFQYWMKYHLTNMPDISGWWTLDNIVAGIAHDRSPNLNHAAVLGPSLQAGVIADGYHFDALNDRVVVPADASTIITTAITIEAFMRSTSLLSQFIVSKFPAPATACYELYTYNLTPRKARFRLYSAAGGTSCPGTIDVCDGEKHHVLGTWDGTDMSLWIDGVFDNSVPFAGPILATDAPVFFGTRSPLVLWWDDLIDNIIIYNRSLDPVTIYRHSQRRYPL